MKEQKKKENQNPPPEISPYLFPLLLGVFGVWCVYDGFFSSDPDMQEYMLFNRIAGCVLIGWSVIDFFRTWKIDRAEKKEK